MSVPPVLAVSSAAPKPSVRAAMHPRRLANSVCRRPASVRTCRSNLSNAGFHSFLRPGFSSRSLIQWAGYWGVASYPKGLAHTGWENGAFNALLPTKEFVDFNEVSHMVVRNANFSFNPPGWWRLFSTLVSNKDLFGQAGELKIGLAAPTGKGRSTAAPVKHRVVSGTDSAPEPLQSVHEAHVESVLAERPGEIEAGLTLIGRQCPASPVGKIDLLCKDKKGNHVVIELKRAGATTGSIIDQVTRYMGWVKTNLASRGAVVRGIIIVNSPDEKLTYSAKAIPHLETKTFNRSIKNF